MLQISKKVTIPVTGIEITAVRARGAGGQNVNKVSTAVHLRFDINASSLPDYYKSRLLKLNDRRITKEGIIVIKAQKHRSREKNREEALARLKELIKGVGVSQKRRKPTKPPLCSLEKRLDRKSRRGKVKVLRGKVTGE